MLSNDMIKASKFWNRNMMVFESAMEITLRNNVKLCICIACAVFLIHIAHVNSRLLLPYMLCTEHIPTYTNEAISAQLCCLVSQNGFTGFIKLHFTKCAMTFVMMLCQKYPKYQQLSIQVFKYTRNPCTYTPHISVHYLEWLYST